MLETAPAEEWPSADPEATVLSLPSPRGGFVRFALHESPIMEPALAKRHPDIRTYSGRGTDEPATTIRADLGKACSLARSSSSDARKRPLSPA